ncbi:hypothetical protein CY34DRAFT_87439, partial [Suillus luteus UH-Slu-Lm8-n1]
ILIYDHLATLPEEIRFIWCRPRATSAMIFLVNRYVAVLGNVLGLLSNFLPVSTQVLHFCAYIRLTSSLYLRRGFKSAS